MIFIGILIWIALGLVGSFIMFLYDYYVYKEIAKGDIAWYIGGALLGILGLFINIVVVSSDAMENINWNEIVYKKEI